MSAATAEAVDPIPNRDDAHKAKRWSYLWRLAHEAVMLNEMQKTKARAARMEKFAATADPKTLDAPEGESDVGVNLGNEYHYHIEQPAAAAQSQSPVQQVARAGARRYLLPLLLGAALPAAGAGAMALYQHWKGDTPNVNIDMPNPQDWKLGVQVTDKP